MKHNAKDARARAARILKTVEAIGEDPHDEGVFITVECGLHSGFPVCCIEFFVKEYRPLKECSVLKWRRAADRYGEAVQQRDDITPGYIPCPSCFQARRRVSVRRCDWHLTARERRQAIAAYVMKAAPF